MAFRDQSQGIPRRFFGHLVSIFTSALCLAGCADNPPAIIRHVGPDQDQQVVIGQGTAQDRTAIEASNQKIFETEQAGVTTATPAPLSPTQPKSGNSQ